MKAARTLRTALGAALLGAVLSACGAYTPRTDQPSTIPPSDQSQAPAQVVRIDGAATMGADLVPDLVDAFLRSLGAGEPKHDQQSPGGVTIAAQLAGLNGPLRFVITDTSTSGGFLALADGRADLVMASRPVTQQEREAADVVGNGYLVGLDALVPVVHPASKVAAISQAQLAGILSCRITDWATVGGAAGHIDVAVPDNLAGDVDLTSVLGDAELCPAARALDTDAQVADAVSADPAAVGLVSSGYVGTAAALRLGPDVGAATLPTQESLVREQYPLTRRLVLFPSVGSSGLVRRFAEFTESDLGQDVVARARFVRSPTPAPAPELCGAPPDYCDFVRSADRLPVAVEFALNSSVPDPVAVTAIARLGQDLRRRGASGRTVLLAGFADDSGPDQLNRRLSEERAAAVGQLLRAQGIAVQSRGFGSARPADTNQTSDGRAHNRRVEIWLAP